VSDTRTTRIIPTNLFSGFIFPHFPEIPFLAIFHFWRFSNFCPEGTFGVGEVAKRGYGQFSENPRTIPLARLSFPPSPSLLGSESSANPLPIGCESSANWLGKFAGTAQCRRLPGRYRAWLLAQRGAIAAPIICELPGNCARIYFLAEGSNGRPAPTIYLQHSSESDALEAPIGDRCSFYATKPMEIVPGELPGTLCRRSQHSSFSLVTAQLQCLATS